MIVAFSNFPGVVWTENILCVFGVKTPFSKFLQRGVDRALVYIRWWFNSVAGVDSHSCIQVVNSLFSESLLPSLEVALQDREIFRFFRGGQFTLLRIKGERKILQEDTKIHDGFCLERDTLMDAGISILGDPGAVNGGARKINRRDERFHESLQGGVKEPLGTDSHQTISKRLGECWLLIGQKIPLYYSAQSANGSF